MDRGYDPDEVVFVNGDGETSRDFCYIENVTQANVLAATTSRCDAVNQVYNVGVDASTTLNQLLLLLREFLRPSYPHVERFTPTYGSFRVGDVRESRADIGKAVHRVEERRLKATAHLFTYCEGDYLIALPLLFRSTGEVRRGWKDATSVYGYSGPVASHERTPVPIVYNFQAALREVLVEQRVITVFSRLHPLNAQHDLLAGLGECRTVGQTVSIDLTLPLEKHGHSIAVLISGFSTDSEEKAVSPVYTTRRNAT